MEFSPHSAKTLRGERGLTRAEAASRIGITRQALYLIEEGVSEPMTGTLLALAEAYECFVEDFCVGHGTNAATSGVARGHDQEPAAVSAKS